jgi:hypothetical protein
VEFDPESSALALIPVIFIGQNFQQPGFGLVASPDDFLYVFERDAVFFLKQQINQLSRRHLGVIEHSSYLPP